MRGRNPSSPVKYLLGSFEEPCSSLEEDFRFRDASGFLALCISLHCEPLEHLPVLENSSHSKMCFLLH